MYGQLGALSRQLLTDKAAHMPSNDTACSANTPPVKPAQTQTLKPHHLHLKYVPMEKQRLGFKTRHLVEALALADTGMLSGHATPTGPGPSSCYHRNDTTWRLSISEVARRLHLASEAARLCCHVTPHRVPATPMPHSIAIHVPQPLPTFTSKHKARIPHAAHAPASASAS